MAVMSFLFADMGQGDCTLIKAPNGHVFVVDCGSTGGLDSDTFATLKSALREAANGDRVTVVLTHPDRDHYNKLIDLLYDGVAGPNVRVDKLYFSLKSSNNSPLGN